MGSGKTAVGRRVADRAGLPFVDLDAEIAARAGMPVAEIFARRGEDAFRRLEREAIDRALMQSGQVIAVGGGAVADEGNRWRLLRGGIVVCLRVAVETVLRRLEGDRSRPLLETPDRRDRIERLLAARADAYAAIPWAVETDGRDVAAVACEVLTGYRRRAAVPARPLRRLDGPGIAAALPGLRRPYHDRYRAMYCSDLDAVITDPVWMRIPADDHMVHRGDGVFEACKFLAGGVYNFDAHLERLAGSAQSVGLAWPGGTASIRALSLETARASGLEDGQLRVLLSRGPGGFGVDPYECPIPALSIVVTRIGPPFMQCHPQGATVRRSAVPAKPAWVAGVKNCNYLPNVLMKKEAVDWGVDFVVGIDDNGCLTECATENIGVVTTAGELRFPKLGQVLRGTTMMRVAALAQKLVDEGVLRAVRFDAIPESLVFEASEMLVVGTTINVVAVRAFEGRQVGTGRPGPVWRALDRCLRADLLHNPALRTPIHG